VLVDEDTQEESIKLSGNQRKLIRDWLISAEILTPKEAAERLVFHDAAAATKAMFMLPETSAVSLAGTAAATKIHIRTQQMGRKWLTIIQDLDDDLDLKLIAREIKAVLHCSAAVVVDEVTGKEIIKLSGNQKETVREWLIASEILTEREAAERLVVHGS
jgi:translation initiation factor SUI1